MLHGIMSAMSQKPVPDLDQLDADSLRALAQQLMGALQSTQQQVQRLSQDNLYKETRIRQLTHEIAVLRRYRYGKKSERLPGEQGSLLDDAVDADLAVIEQELVQLGGTLPEDKPTAQPKRQVLPPELPRTDIHHEPHDTTCP